MITSNNNNIYHTFTNKIKILIDILKKYQYLIFLFDIFIYNHKNINLNNLVSTGTCSYLKILRYTLLYLFEN